MGDKSHYLRRLTIKEIKKSTAEDYLNSFNNAIKYELDIFYTGRIDFDTVSESVNNNLTLSDNPVDSQSPMDLEVKNWDEDAVYIVNDKKVVQSQIYFGINGNSVNNANYPISQAYNKYFGRGMGSLVFQEIREFRSLAYSCGARYVTPFYSGNNGYFGGYIGCQADKSIEAISVFKDISLNMPEKPDRLNQIQSGLIKSINSNRPSFRSFPIKVSNWIKQGHSDDPRKSHVAYYNNMSFDDIIEFQKQTIADKPMVITILTDTKRVNTKELEKFGKIVELKKKDILN